MITNKKEIKKWLDEMEIERYKINPDNTVDVEGSVIIYHKRLTIIPVQFRNVKYHFICDNNKLDSFIGMPSNIGGDLYLDNNNISSLHNLHKHLKKLDHKFFCDQNPIKSHILSVFFIKGLNFIEIDNKQVQKIVNDNLNEGDVHKCQEELIQAGFEEFAKL